MRRVFITGLGTISPFGRGVNTLLDNLYNGNSAVINMRDKWASKIKDLNCLVGSPIKENIDEREVERKYRRFMGPTAVISVLAAREAINDSGLSDDKISSGKCGVSFASTLGSVVWIENGIADYLSKASVRDLSSGIFFKIMSHTCAANIAHVFNIQGRNYSPACACASSALSIGLGYESIKYGIQDVMICGGADELHVIVPACFDLVQAASTHYNENPTRTPRPFDKDRDGTVCGEGAGVLILESEESAKSRGAKIYAEIIGFANVTDGEHLAEPHSESISKCIKNAINDAGISEKNIDYVNAHATATVLGDAAESKAIRDIFGENNVSVSSFKGHLGHTMGASGVIEAIACIKMTEKNYIIPTLNLENVDDECKGLNHITSLKKENINIFLKNSFAFGGVNTSLIFKRYQND